MNLKISNIISFFFQRNLQISTIGAMCKFGYPDCISKSVELFNNWIEKNEA